MIMMIIIVILLLTIILIILIIKTKYSIAIEIIKLKLIEKIISQTSGLNTLKIF